MTAAVLAAGLSLAGAESGSSLPAFPPSRGQMTPAARDTLSLRVPDVPYVAQGEALCGGAAVTMALRYWGERGVRAEDFRHLVSGRPAGIATDDLMGAVRHRGWVARRLPNSPGELSNQLEMGRPAVALIRVAPDRFHYVVVLAVTPSRVLFHDPARGPYRVMQRGEWSEAREAAGRWAAVVLPGGGERAAAGPGADTATGGVRANEEVDEIPAEDVAPDLPTPCGPLVREGVREARDGEFRAGAEALRAASELCPRRPEPWGELAGLRFRQGNYGEAARLAARAARLSGGDPYPWRVLGTARYLSGDRRGALRAWNRIGEPAVYHVRIQGLRRTRHGPALEMLDLSPGTILTPGRLLRGRRRLEEVPALREARVDYRRLKGGRAEVRVAAWERRPPTDGMLRAATVAVRALADHTLRLSWPSPTGGGAVVNAAWRWTPGRTRVSLGTWAPGPGGAVATWGVEGAWEREGYAPEALPPRPSGDATFRESTEVTEERRRAVLSTTDWITGRLRVRASVGYERWTDGRIGPGEHPYISTEAGASWLSDGGGLAAGVRAGAWLPLVRSRPSFRTLTAAVLGRLGEAGSGITASFRGGFRRASDEAPLALWPGAGTGRARVPLLRAHPLLKDGRIAGPVFGRSLVYAGPESAAWLGGLGPLRVGVAGFVDAAVAADRADEWSGKPAHVDIGTGLRLRVGSGDGVLRVDGSVGLRDGRTALSVGWSSLDEGEAIGG